MPKLTKDQKRRAKIVRGELTKARCWMTGWKAARNVPLSDIGTTIPGEDGLRQATLLIDELLADGGAR